MIKIAVDIRPTIGSADLSSAVSPVMRCKMELQSTIPLCVEGPCVSQVRVHQLAAELAIESGEVIAYLESQGKRVRGPSTVIAESAAAGVRRRFRTPIEPLTLRPSAAAQARLAAVRPTQTQPIAPAAPPPHPAVTAPPERSVAPLEPAVPSVPAAIPLVSSLLNPFAVAGAVAVPPAPAQVAPRPSGRHHAVDLTPVEAVSVKPTEEDLLRDWVRRDINADQRAEWLAAGLRPDEAGLADQCRTAGINPAELHLRLSGRTAVHRLRGGESATSVWARIQDGEHQPRRGTRLTGRFQLS